MMSKAWWTLSKKIPLAILCPLVAMTQITHGVGCTPTPWALRSEAMPSRISQLVGTWEKASSPTCSQVYPDLIQFQERGLYFGKKEPSGTFTQWDVGTFEIAGPGQIKMSVANDAILTYEFSVLNNLLKFVDPDGCEFSYRKVL